MSGFLIGSGYFNNPCAQIPAQEMARAWIGCIRKYADPQPKRIVVVTAGGHAPEPTDGVELIRCTGDVGNLQHKVAGKVAHDYAGWTPPMVITAMLAYNEGLDYVFQEQDRLDFGPYIARGFDDIGDGGMAIGPPLRGMGMPATQSLFFVRHHYICKFLRDYLGQGPDDNELNKGEYKFARLHQYNPDQVKVLSFGVDRDRPLPWGEPVWGAQQWGRDEFETAKAKGLIPT